MPHRVDKKPGSKDHKGKEKLTTQAKASSSQLLDNRQEAVSQRKLQNLADNSDQVKQLKTYQTIANNNASKVIQLQGEGGGAGEKKGSKKETLASGAKVLKQGVTTGFVEKAGTGIASAVDSTVGKSSVVSHVNQSATGAAVVGDLGGVIAGGLQVHTGATAKHLTTGERTKEVASGTVTSAATATKAGLDIAHVVTHSATLAPPAAVLGAVVGGVEAVKGGIDIHSAHKMKTALASTSSGTKSAVGAEHFTTLEHGALVKQKEAILSTSLGGGKLVTGAVLAAIGFAHGGPIGLAVSAAILGALGAISLGVLAKRRYDQRQLGIELVNQKKHEVAVRLQNWQMQFNQINHMLDGESTNLAFYRQALENQERKMRVYAGIFDAEQQREQEAKTRALQQHVERAEASYTEVYDARLTLIATKPKLDARYDERRIKGHLRGYGDVFREELSEKAEAAASVLHRLIQKAWKYQRNHLRFEILRANQVHPIDHGRVARLQTELNTGKGILTGPGAGDPMDLEVLQIMKSLGVAYNRSEDKPSVADLYKVINKNLASYKG